MVDLNTGFNRKNTELLFEGMWYSELPPIMDIDAIINKIDDLFDTISSNKANYYRLNEMGRICGYKNIPRSKNRHNDGAEPIVFYDYKSNGAWREMQIPNLIYYISFVYNTIDVFEELFGALYLDMNNKKLISNSNSYLVFDELFVIHNFYGDIVDLEIRGQFTNKNIKKKMHLVFDENKKRYLKMEQGYLYFMKLDIESFFPNLYTHFFERMKDYEPYKCLCEEKDYFNFLDVYNMKIDNNQTKGIPAGVFSSNISSELLMLCIDAAIRKEIEDKDVGYIRYVDDMTFFADKEETLYEIKAICQKILNEYRLRINGNKTEIHLCTRKNSQTNIKEFLSGFPYLSSNVEDVYNFRVDDLFEIKEYIKRYLENKKISQVKSILTMFTKQVSSSKLLLCDCECELFSYIWKLIGEDEKLSVHVYRLLNEILNVCSEDLKNKCVELLKKKTDLVDSKFAGSLLQIWHYYTLFKYDEPFKEEVIRTIADRKLSPILVTMLVRNGNCKNGDVFKYIRDSYKREIGKSGNEWKNTIMFSKWWLPIYQISLNDEYNYDNWLHLNSYPSILRIISQV